MTLPKHVEELLEDLAESLQIPPSRYEAAERSYRSVGEWLQREASTLRKADPQVYIQGSFRLGTAIRPVSDAEDYDVDLVCELSVSKTRLSQQQVKSALGYELKEYAVAHSMDDPEEGNRCWTLQYADSAQFHLDTLPAVPDGTYKRLLLEQRALSTEWSGTAIAITDRTHPKYRQISEDWPHSNPKGYCEWFRSRMKIIFDARRLRLAMEARASVEEIPEYKVRTPLQSAIQILKRHRDVMFVERSDEGPISIIITTLAAHAYNQEPTIAGALYSILARMDSYIEYREGIAWIENPTDPEENFADKWQKQPELQKAFFEWLEEARADFAAAATAATREHAFSGLETHLGKQLVETARVRRPGSGANALARLISAAKSRAGIVLNPAHRRRPPWNPATQGKVEIEQATVMRNGFRPEGYDSDGPALPKHASLTFQADTNVPNPYKVYWQVVNTGFEATQASGLRGGFDEGVISAGKLTRKENTLYRGRHSIECFIVKDGLLAARSGQFIVNIR